MYLFSQQIDHIHELQDAWLDAATGLFDCATDDEDALLTGINFLLGC